MQMPSYNPEIARRLLICTAVGVAMSGTAYLSAWQNMRDAIGYRWEHQRTYRWLRDLKTALDEYRAVNGKYPEKLAEVKKIQTKYVRADDSGQISDPWSNPFQYGVEGTGYTLFSLGADGKRGGDGLNRDLNVRDLESKNVDVNGEPRVAIPTLWQFTFECPTFGPRLLSALAGVCAFVACLVIQRPQRRGLTRPLIELGLTLAACLVTAVALSLLHVPTRH
jgi:type II secretory pathway pseudopilin PulG